MDANDTNQPKLPADASGIPPRSPVAPGTGPDPGLGIEPVDLLPPPDEDERRALELGQLTTRQERAIAALMTEQTILRASEAAGVNERTLHKWLNEPLFSAEYRRVRREAFRQAVSLCQRLASSAVATLAKIMADTKAPYSAKVSAAQALLKFGREGIELEDLEARLSALELSQLEEARAKTRDHAWREQPKRSVA